MLTQAAPLQCLAPGPGAYPNARSSLKPARARPSAGTVIGRSAPRQSLCCSNSQAGSSQRAKPTPRISFSDAGTQHPPGRTPVKEALPSRLVLARSWLQCHHRQSAADNSSEIVNTQVRRSVLEPTRDGLPSPRAAFRVPRRTLAHHVKELRQADGCAGSAAAAPHHGPPMPANCHNAGACGPPVTFTICVWPQRLSARTASTKPPLRSHGHGGNVRGRCPRRSPHGRRRRAPRRSACRRSAKDSWFSGHARRPYGKRLRPWPFRTTPERAARSRSCPARSRHRRCPCGARSRNRHGY